MNQIPESVSRLWAFNLGPHVTDLGWTSDHLATGDYGLDWIGTGPAATKALAGGVKKMVLATPFYQHFAGVFAKSRQFQMLSIRITQAKNGPATLLLNFSDIDVGDIITTDFSKLPPAVSDGSQASFTSIFIKVKDPTVDVFTGLEMTGPQDHSNERVQEQQTLRLREFLNEFGL
jgi:hypothetical protein